MELPGGDAGAAQPVGLGTHSARGVAYLFASMTGAKVIGYAAQVALSYLLSPADFGVMGLTFTIAKGSPT